MFNKITYLHINTKSLHELIERENQIFSCCYV